MTSRRSIMESKCHAFQRDYDEIALEAVLEAYPKLKDHNLPWTGLRLTLNKYKGTYIGNTHETIESVVGEKSCEVLNTRPIYVDRDWAHEQTQTSDPDNVRHMQYNRLADNLTETGGFGSALPPHAQSAFDRYPNLGTAAQKFAKDKKSKHKKLSKKAPAFALAAKLALEHYQEHVDKSPWKTINQKMLLNSKARMTQFLAEVTSQNPDVVTLQEVDNFHANGEYCLKTRMELLGYAGVFAAKNSSNGLFGFNDGCAIFWDHRRFEQVGNARKFNFKEYKNDTKTETKISGQVGIYVRLKNVVTEKEFAVMSVHCKSGAGNPEQNRQLASVVCELRDLNIPLILGVDLNADYKKPEGEDKMDLLKNIGLKSAYVEKGIDINSTWQRRTTGQQPEKIKTKREDLVSIAKKIDHSFYSDEFEVKNVLKGATDEYMRTRFQNGGLLAGGNSSDHIFLVADYKMKDGAQDIKKPVVACETYDMDLFLPEGGWDVFVEEKSLFRRTNGEIYAAPALRKEDESFTLPQIRFRANTTKAHFCKSQLAGAVIGGAGGAAAGISVGLYSAIGASLTAFTGGLAPVVAGAGVLGALAVGGAHAVYQHQIWARNEYNINITKTTAVNRTYFTFDIEGKNGRSTIDYVKIKGKKILFGLSGGLTSRHVWLDNKLSNEHARRIGEFIQRHGFVANTPIEQKMDAHDKETAVKANEDDLLTHTEERKTDDNEPALNVIGEVIERKQRNEDQKVARKAAKEALKQEKAARKELKQRIKQKYEEEIAKEKEAKKKLIVYLYEKETLQMLIESRLNKHGMESNETEEAGDEVSDEQIEVERRRLGSSARSMERLIKLINDA